MTGQNTPVLGWVVLSEANRAAAERILDSKTAEDTRDELGFGVIHFAYANRFFPGTSVQQTRLRYVWFICWTYQELAASHGPRTFSVDALRNIEVRTGRKLLRSIDNPNRSGIIGWTRFKVGKEPVMMPSRIYWSALKTWGVLQTREPSDHPPGQAELHARWQDWAHETSRRDELSLDHTNSIFSDLPPRPKDWSKKDANLSLNMTRDEAKLIQSKWQSFSDQPEQNKCLLSRLGQADFIPNELWSKRVAELCSPQDKLALQTARRVASLVCIGRAIYAAMIENLKNSDTRQSSKMYTQHEWLEELRVEHRDLALSLNFSDLARDVPKLTPELRDLLVKIQEWTDRGGKFDHLRAPFLQRETDLKDTRALLAPSAKKLREEWTASKPAEPLNYRWHIVRRFLKDIAEA